MKIVDIQSFETWYDGSTVQANKLGLRLIGDNLINEAEFQYAVYSNDMQVFADYLIMAGLDYQQWTGSNEGAMAWAASKLNIILLSS